MLVAFAVLLLGGGVGLLLALRSAAGRLSPATNPPLPAVSLPVGTPGASLALPPIRGVTVTQITSALKARGYECTDARHVAETWITSCTLTDDHNGVFYDVSVGGSDPTSVGLVSAGLISTRGGQPTNAEAAQFFPTVLGALGQGGAASQATTWILQNLDAGGDTTAGNLRLHLGRPASNYLLVVTAT